MKNIAATLCLFAVGCTVEVAPSPASQCVKPGSTIRLQYVETSGTCGPLSSDDAVQVLPDGRVAIGGDQCVDGPGSFTQACDAHVDRVCHVAGLRIDLSARLDASSGRGEMTVSMTAQTGEACSSTYAVNRL